MSVGAARLPEAARELEPPGVGADRRAPQGPRRASGALAGARRGRGRRRGPAGAARRGVRRSALGRGPRAARRAACGAHAALRRRPQAARGRGRAAHHARGRPAADRRRPRPTQTGVRPIMNLRSPTGSTPPAALEAVRERALAEGLLDVAYADVDSPLGPLLAARTPRGLACLAYEDEHRDAWLERISSRLSPRMLEAPAQLDDVRRELDQYFAGRRDRFDIPVDLSLVRGPFGRRILEATVAIPFGSVSTYWGVAEAAGNAAAVRAAGNALGANPIPIVVPCHRVLRTGGTLGGYTGGLERKERLLALEGVAL